MKMLHISVYNSQQFFPDYACIMPAEGYGGRRIAEVELAPDHIALSVMHAWGCGAMV